jgi:predicted outer membrane repeat protein
MRRRSWLLPLAAAVGLTAPIGSLTAPAGAGEAGPVVTVCNAAHLKAAVAAAPEGSTIRFACDGHIRIKSEDDIVEVTGSESGPRSLGIDGAGHRVTIDGNKANSMVFLAPGSSLRLANLTLTDGLSQGSGGAIENWGNLTVDTVRFTNNYSANAGGAIRNYGNGSVVIDNSTFVGNQSTCEFLLGGGGAIEQNSRGPLTVTNSLFRDNAAIGVGVGGAIYAHADNFGPRGNGIPRGLLMGPVTVVGSRFINNSAAATFIYDDFGLQGGGAIWSAGVSVSIDDTRFLSNHGNFSAGAIRFFGSVGNPTGIGLEPRSLTVTNSVFDSNVAHDFPLPPPYGSFSGRGGAIVAGSFYPPEASTNVDPVTISGSSFTSNIASVGSAIFTSEPLDLAQSRVISNLVTNSGRNGALWLIDTTATVRETEVLRNKGGGCNTVMATIVDQGGNVERPGNSCGFNNTA